LGRKQWKKLATAQRRGKKFLSVFEEKHLRKLINLWQNLQGLFVFFQNKNYQERPKILLCDLCETFVLSYVSKSKEELNH